MTGLFLGSGYFLKGLHLISKKSLIPFVLIPLFVNTILFAVLIWYGAEQFDAVMTWLFSFLPDWLNWLEYLLWPLFAITVILTAFYTFTMVANLIAAPFNGLLAQKTEEYLTGQKLEDSSDSSFMQVLKDIIPSILIEIRKILYFMTRAIPVLILFVIPVVNVIAPILWVLLSAWFFTLEYAEYPIGNHGISFNDQLTKMRQKRLMSLGFGGSILLMTMVPFINFLVMPVAVCGATAMWVKQWKE